MEHMETNGVPVQPTFEPENVAPAAPVYQEPAAPVYQAPVYQAPAAPVYQEPAYQAPAQPVYQAPAQPVYQTPAQPVYQVPAQPVFGCEKTPEPKKAPAPKKRSNWWMIPVAIVLAISIALSSSYVTAWMMINGTWDEWDEKFQNHQEAVDNKLDVIQENNNAAQNNTPTEPGTNDTPVVVPSDGAMTPSQVYAKNLGACVAIANEGVTTNLFGQVSRTASSGSGFILTADGYVVSNYHVVEGAETLTVILSDGTEYTAQLVGYDATNDVSLMKIDAKDLPYVELGSSSDLVVGDMVCAIGNPLGELTSSLTVGYISAMDRQISTEKGQLNMIQTDAAINSGNSGGPLFNDRGQVIGINTAKYSGTSGSGATIEGIGFAIPIDDVKDIISDLKEFGYVDSAYLGVEVRDVDSSGISYGLPMGAFVQTVVSGGAAEKAGIKTQDIIVNMGGYDVESVNDLLKVLRKVEPGKETTVTVYRAGQQVNLKIVPESKPQS